MAITELDYDTNNATIAAIDKGHNFANMAVAMSHFWNRHEVSDVLGEQVTDFIEALFEGVADQYETMALYELGDYWEDCAWVNDDDSAEILGKAIIGIIDSGCGEADRYIEGQEQAVAMVREFLRNA